MTQGQTQTGTMPAGKPLAGKAAIVTGASRGIGAAIARRLAADGADVAILYGSSTDKAKIVAGEIVAAGGKAQIFQADAADAGAVREAVRAAVHALGRLDILVNNAGVADFKPLSDLTEADFDRAFAINVKAVFAGVQEAAPLMGEGGRIITIGSVNGQRMPFPGGSLYAATKFAVQGFTRGWARDLAPRGITVNVVQPGPVDTDMNPADGDFAPMIMPMLALKRYGTGAEVADLVAFLASPGAGYITGAAINIDGGMEA